MLKQLKQRHRHVLLHRLGNVAGAEHLDIDGAVAEHGDPDKGNEGRNQQYPLDEFADRTPVGNPRYEHADKGRPGDPPPPVEDGPGLLPIGRFVGFVPGGELGQVLQIETDIFHQRLHDEQGRA